MFALQPQLQEGALYWEKLLGDGPSLPLLFFRDPGRFASCLFACWRKGLVPILLPDDGPDALARFPQGTLLSDQHEPAAPKPFRPEWPADCALVLSTSGSTGRPKQVVKTFAQLEAEVRSLESMFGDLVTGRKLLTTVSHQHIYGLLFTVLWPLSQGRPVSAPRCFFPEELEAQMGDDARVVLISSPTHARMLIGMAQNKARTARDLAVFSSGGRLDGEIARGIAKTGVKLFEIYGSTETGGIARREGGEPAPWKLFPGVQSKVEDGELLVRSEWCERGEGEWYATRDRVLASPEGFVLLGRSDRIVKVAEKRVSLDELDALLRESPDVANAHCFLPPKRGTRDEVHCICELTPQGLERLDAEGDAAMIRGLRQALTGRIETVALPRHWRFAPVPVSGQGKLRQAEVFRLFDYVDVDGLWCRVITRGAEEVEGELWVDPAYRRLEGHFPGHPVVPGVSQILWARQLVSLASGPARIGEAAQVENTKFHAILRPGTLVNISVKVLPSGKWNFTIRDEIRKYSSGRIFA
jgi:3-hydroxymyristoyl/3-hydroxydecanoyl-(acyl carrier protein) dehydratase